MTNLAIAQTNEIAQVEATTMFDGADANMICSAATSMICSAATTMTCSAATSMTCSAATNVTSSDRFSGEYATMMCSAADI